MNGQSRGPTAERGHAAPIRGVAAPLPPRKGEQKRATPCGIDREDDRSAQSEDAYEPCYRDGSMKNECW